MVDFWTGPLSYINPFAYDWTYLSGDKSGEAEESFEKADLAEQGKLGSSGDVIIDMTGSGRTDSSQTDRRKETVVKEKDEPLYPKVDLSVPFTGYPKIEPYKPIVFQFSAPETTKKEGSEEASGFVTISRSPFKSPALPSSGIPHPHSSSPVPTATSQRELDTRKSEGKVVRWWSLFKHSHNQLPLVGKSEFSKAMMGFNFSHNLTLVKRDDQDQRLYQRNVAAFDESHHKYLEALKKPVAVLQSEVAGLPVEDQVKYFDAASREVTQVPQVKTRAWKKEKVERDFKSTALVSLIDSVVKRIIQSPAEIFKVDAYVKGHLTPFARISGDRVDPKDGLFAQPIEHEVAKERKAVTMDLHAYKALVQDNISKRQRLTAPEQDVQQWGLQETLRHEIFSRAIPALDGLHAPKSIEELEEKIKDNQIALGTLLNDALAGRPTDADWKQQVRELVDGYRFLEWQHRRFFPGQESRLAAFNSNRIELQLSEAVFKYRMLAATLERASTGSVSKVTRNVYIENVKAFMPVQAAIKGIAEAMEGAIILPPSTEAAIAFDPFSSKNAIPLTESDLL